MAVLKKTNLVGSVVGLYINPNREDGVESSQRDRVDVSFGGFVGETHSGETRKSCSRVLAQYPRGTEIRNVRQVSILSQEELSMIAAKMGIAHLYPQWVGANLLLSGIPSVSMLPPSTRLIFENGVSLVVDMENEPCMYPGRVIEKHFPAKGKQFPKCALGLRGVTGWVEREGVLRVGESCTVHFPPQRIYPEDYLFVQK